MGSSSSKTRRIGGDCGTAGSSCSPSSSFSSVVSGSSTSSRKRRTGKSREVFSSSCLGSSFRVYESDVDDQVSDHHDKASGIIVEQTESESDEVKAECYQTAKIDGSDDMSCVSPKVELGEWTRASRGDNMPRFGGSSSQAFSGRSLNRPSLFLSRFRFVPGSVSFRLRRAASVGSSRAYPSNPTSLAVSTVEEDPLNSSYPYSAPIRSHDYQIISDDQSTRPDVSFPPFGSRMDMESLNRRPGHRGNCSREPEDRNIRFSRTLSVGRLRNRVLRQSSISELTSSPSQQERTAITNENLVNSLISSPNPLRSIPHSFLISQNNDVEALHPRETRHHDLLEHRSNFLERRRRIRSQVRALQRLGSRFENLSGHERYCILSGQHRTGRCSCRIGTRDSNSNDGGTPNSISRIVMLAEALFEVLDEIHQQSVVLSSQPVSSIGSVPAPNEVVESLPIKVYNKSVKFQYEEVAQCYICLVEYEEGDELRVLPCHHEFHTKCIDKWLKEIHRVCPLCRGDICRSDTSCVES